MHEVETWVKQLESSELTQQIAAAEALTRLSDSAQEAIVTLVEHCGSAEHELRSWCMAALEEVGPPVAGQINRLAELASSANNDVAFWAITLLGRAGPLAVGAVPMLAQRASDDSAPEVQRRANWAMKRIQAT